MVYRSLCCEDTKNMIIRCGNTLKMIDKKVIKLPFLRYIL